MKNKLKDEKLSRENDKLRREETKVVLLYCYKVLPSHKVRFFSMT